MTDHQVILAGVWIVTAVCWGSRVVAGWATVVMTLVALYVSFGM